MLCEGVGLVELRITSHMDLRIKNGAGGAVFDYLSLSHFRVLGRTVEEMTLYAD